MKRFLWFTLLLAVLLLAGRWVWRSAFAPVDPARLVAPGEVIYYRNFRSPPLLKWFAYAQPAKEYRQGKAYLLPPTDEWKQLIRKVAPGQEKCGFPVAFATTRLFPDGSRHLVAGQLSVRFTGDGMWSGAGPEVHCDLLTIDISRPREPRLLWKGSDCLGPQQNCNLRAGLADPTDETKITLVSESKSGITSYYDFTTTPGYGVRMKSHY